MVNMKEHRRETSDYRDFGGEIRPFPDLIPLVGVATFTRRRYLEDKEIGRKREINAAYLAKELVTLGTYDWPKPVDWKAILRCQLLQARNIGFAFYHASPFLLPVAVAYITS